MAGSGENHRNPSATEVAEYFSDSAITVTVQRDAPRSEQQTLSNQQAIREALEDAVDEYSVIVNPREPKGVLVAVRIPLNMAGATSEQLDQLLPALIADKSAAIAWHDGPLSGKDDVYGGAQIEVRNSDQKKCTTGFAVTTGKVTGLVTAGHCSDVDLDYRAPDGDKYEMTFVEGRDDDSGDFAWYTTDEVEDNRIYTDVDELREITSRVDNFDEMHVGWVVCKYGRKTFHTCDTIYSLDKTTTRY